MFYSSIIVSDHPGQIEVKSISHKIGVEISEILFTQLHTKLLENESICFSLVTIY